MKERTEKHITDFFKNHSETVYLEDTIRRAITEIVSLKEQNKILLCGNGGSAADCEHIAGELLKSFALKRHLTASELDAYIDMYGEEGGVIAHNLQKGIKAIPLVSFVGANTAFINDCKPSLLYAQMVNSLGIAGDILIAISTSGNSQNVVLASKVAKVLGMKVIALTGESGGKLRDIADILINVPSQEVYKIQEYHLPFYHLLCLCVESELFEN